MIIDWYRVKRSLSIAMFLLALIMGNVLFWGSWHNLDLLQNYSLIYNDFNRENSCDSGFYDVRDASDCNLYGCKEFQQIYMESKFMAFVSYILMLGIIIEAMVRYYKKKDDESRNKRDNSSVQRDRKAG